MSRERFQAAFMAGDFDSAAAIVEEMMECISEQGEALVGIANVASLEFTVPKKKGFFSRLFH